MGEFDRRLQTSLVSFVDEIQLLLRCAAIDALSAAIGERATAPIGRTLIGRDAPRKRPEPRPSRPRAGGKKRSPGSLARLMGALDTYIRRNKGLGVEAIGKAMGVSTRELALPLKKLLADRRVAARGVKRATRYYPC